MRTETTVEHFKERQKVMFQGKVYDFGYYSTRKNYCVLYAEGETNMQDSVSVPVYNVSPAPTRAAERPVTPLPWFVNDKIPRRLFIESDAGFVASMHIENCGSEEGKIASRIDAAFIITAVNNHATLLRQKRELVDLLCEARQVVRDRAAGGKMITTIVEADDLRQRIDAALNAAVGEGKGEK